MKNKKGSFLIFSGIVLIAAAIYLAGVNVYESNVAAKSVNRVNEKLNITQADMQAVPLYISHPEIEMPTEEIDGNSYIGLLEIPARELQLPVISRWSDEKLKIAPCRYTGSVYLDNMIIAAHDYRYHFAKLRQLDVGRQVIFTDIDGNVFNYTVSYKEILSPDAVEEMQAGEWDLTMFTCTADAANRVVVRCEKS